MNKFKFPLVNSVEAHENHKLDHQHEPKPQKKEEIELFNILEKCTQILRQDRIWIRNKLKESDTTILGLFRKYKKPLNLQQLQIHLRKYVNSVRQQYKLDQLNKFKQNISNVYVTEKPIKQLPPTSKFKKVENKSHNTSKNNWARNHSEEFNTKNRTFEGAITSQIEKLNNSYRLDQHRNKSHNFQSSSSARFGLLHDKINKNKSFVTTNPKSRVKELSQQSYINRTTSQKKFEPKKMSNEKILQQSHPFQDSKIRNHEFSDLIKQQEKKESSNSDKRNSGNKLQQKPAVQSFDQYYLHHDIPKSKSPNENMGSSLQYQSPSIHINNDVISESTSYFDQQPSFDYSYIPPVSGNYINNNSFITNKTNNTINAALQAISPNPTATATATTTTTTNINNTTVTNKYVYPESTSNSFFKTYKPNDESLFTNPALLMQCRKILKETESAKKDTKASHLKDDMILPVTSVNYFPTTTTFSHRIGNNGLEFENTFAKPVQSSLFSYDEQKSSPIQTYEYLPMQGTFGFNNKHKLDSLLSKDYCFSETKNLDIKNVSLRQDQEKEQTNTKNANSKQSKLLTTQNNLLQQQYVEDIVDIVFSNQKNPFLFIDEYERIIREHFSGYQNYEAILLLPIKQIVSSKLTITDLGDTLQKIGMKIKQNPVREVFNLIDIDRKRYFTFDDYQKFLDQIMESEQEGFQETSFIAYKLFNLADINYEKQVNYWSLYWIKSSKEFCTFQQYLAQFEFEIQEEKQQQQP